MLYGALFMLGAHYTLLKGAHIRTDMLWEKFSPRTKGRIDAVAYIFFFFPAMILLFYASVDEAWHSWRMGELSEQTAWRPILWPFKAVVPITALLLLIQGVSELLKSLYAARTGRFLTTRRDDPDMSGNEILGLVMLVLMVGVIFVGFPISFTLLFLALVFGWIGLGTLVFDLAFFQTIGMMKEQTLAAVPLFIFMGYVVEQAGLMERLFRAFQVMLAPVRGSLYLGVILTATVFAMATGIVGAAVTVLGIMAAPIMIKSGYSPRLSAGAIAAGGTLGILIPPSVMLVVMGPVINVSVAKLYAAAFGPGFLLAGLYIVYTLDAQLPEPGARPAGAQGGARRVVRSRSSARSSSAWCRWRCSSPPRSGRSWPAS